MKKLLPYMLGLSLLLGSAALFIHQANASPADEKGKTEEKAKKKSKKKKHSEDEQKK